MSCYVMSNKICLYFGAFDGKTSSYSIAHASSRLDDALFILAFFGVFAIGHSSHTSIDGADESWYV
jgi:hypothetical protein